MLQIILAIILVILLLVVGFSIYNMELINSIRTRGVTKTKIPIFTGIKDFKIVSNETYNTSDKNSSSYKAINDTPSVNQQSGAEYTYNFWLYKDAAKYGTSSCPRLGDFNTDQGMLEEKNNKQTVLFVKGNTDTGTYENICGKNKTDIMIKNPLVKLERCGKNLTVEFNTVSSIDAIREKTPIGICDGAFDTWNNANSHKLTLSGLDSHVFNKKWNMITICIQDTYPSDPYPVRNKVRCRIYVNTGLELDTYVDGTLDRTYNKNKTLLKLNKGHLHIAPNINNLLLRPKKDEGLMMADMSYYNYILDSNEIDNLFNIGYSNRVSPPPGGDIKGKEYEKADKPTSKMFNMRD
jgi:hypothetical protein